MTTQNIVFAPGHRYAIVMAPEYGNAYSTHRSERQAAVMSRAMGRHTHMIVDTAGQQYQAAGSTLVKH